MKANISKVTKECNNCCLCNSEAGKSNQTCIIMTHKKKNVCLIGGEEGKLLHLLLKKEARSWKERNALRRGLLLSNFLSTLEIASFCCEMIGVWRCWSSSMTESRRKSCMYTAPITAIRVETLFREKWVSIAMMKKELRLRYRNWREKRKSKIPETFGQ